VEGSPGLRWPLRFIVAKHDRDLIQDHVNKRLTDPQPLRYYRRHGLTDQEADWLAVSLGDLPYEIWPGWIEAGLDNE
jgi:hypothetical protein